MLSWAHIPIIHLLVQDIVREKRDNCLTSITLGWSRYKVLNPVPISLMT